jgi:hypothetical protein
MTDQHRATPEQWKHVEQRILAIDPGCSCILELRDRIAALEAAASIGQPVTPANTSTPTDSLVKRVAFAIAGDAGDADGPLNWKPEARAAIRVIAAAARAKDLNGQNVAVMPWSGFARWLEQEARG